MINKELLSTVLGYEVFDALTKRLSNNCLFYRTNDEATIRRHSPYLPSINIYELAHKCKEWTIKYSGWTLQSYTNERGSGVCRIKVGDGQEINKLIALSEPEAIFKACEWILTKDSK